MIWCIAHTRSVEGVFAAPIHQGLRTNQVPADESRSVIVSSDPVPIFDLSSLFDPHPSLILRDFFSTYYIWRPINNDICFSCTLLYRLS